MSETPVIDDLYANSNLPAPPSASHHSSSGSESLIDSPASSRGRQLRRSAPRKAKSRGGTSSPGPKRRPPPSPASSYTSTRNTIPAIQKWTVQGLRLALSNADVQFHRRMTKAELYCLYASSLADTASPKSAPQKTINKPGAARGSPYSRPGQSTSTARRGRPLASRHSRISASAGTATDFPDAMNPSIEGFQQLVPLAVGQLHPPANTPPAVNTAGHPRNISSPAPGAPVLSHPVPTPGSWPTAPPSTTSARLPQLAMQAPVLGHFPATLEAAASASMTPLAAQAAAIPSLLSLPQNRSNFSLATATAMPVPINAPALEPPPVSGNIRSQILTEVQAAGAQSRSLANTGTSLFGADIPVNHPLKTLLDASLNSITQAVSLRTLQSYLTVWKSFKSFHQAFNIPFPDFSVLTITSYISFLNSSKNLQASSIKGYMSGVQFFHKLIFNSPSAAIASSQTSMLIKGIQRTQPARPDARQPITLDILTRCISTLRKGYHSKHVDRTLDTMFILAFFGFLRCSEMATTSIFNPLIHPTVSDLSVLDSETMSFSIKQSKTDQTRRGHFIYIFNLQSPIQPYQTLLAYLHFWKSQTKTTLDPLFVDESNCPDTCFWFQKHLKAVLLLSGIPADHFSGHSFRIGVATTAAQKGLSQSQIQALGRWTSEAFKSYIRSDHSIIREAHRTLISQII
ncbi:mucin-17-like [Triplophysa rosa]|uniref:mucin-17-like n=1 Tax=Triplophysa rosa TaxID=992332 RepID=UPI002546017C|nr:mucin-17-like [Triplophysa rosa]